MHKLIKNNDSGLLNHKRLIWNEKPPGEGLTVEAITLRERISDSKTNVGDSEQKVRGKVNAIAREVSQLHEKVAPLGAAVFDRFKSFIKTTTGVDVNTLDKAESNAEQIQMDVNKSLEANILKFKQNENEKLRELDTGLDRIMARVQMRKELATALEPLGEKVMIGTAFETKLKELEPNLDSPTDLSSFRKQLELAHEFTKFAKMLNTARTLEPKALSLETSKIMPEIGIAYTRPDGRHNYYKYWVEVRNDSPVVYAIDRSNGRIQKFDPQNAQVGEDAWVFADEPGSEYAIYQSQEFRNRDGSPNQKLRALMPGDIDPADARIQKMLNNQRAERAFIDAATRNYTPTAQERQIPAEFERKFTEAGTQNNGSRLSEMLRYLRSDEHRDLITGTGQPVQPPQPEQPEQRPAPEQVEQNLEQVQLRLKADENREVELKEGIYEMNTGKIEADRTLLTFDQLGTGVSMSIDDKNFPKMKLRPGQPEFNLYREYFEVTNNKINFKRNHDDKAKIIFDLGNELSIPVILKKGEDEVMTDIKIKINPKKENVTQKPPETIEANPAEIKSSLERFQTNLNLVLNTPNSFETPSPDPFNITSSYQQLIKTELIADIDRMTKNLESKNLTELVNTYDSVTTFVKEWMESKGKTNLTDTAASQISGLITYSTDYINRLDRTALSPNPTPNQEVKPEEQDQKPSIDTKEGTNDEYLFEGSSSRTTTLRLSELKQGKLLSLKKLETGALRTLEKVELVGLDGVIKADVTDKLLVIGDELHMSKKLDASINDIIRCTFRVNGVEKQASIVLTAN
jgi:hypothetical protein